MRKKTPPAPSAPSRPPPPKRLAPRKSLPQSLRAWLRHHAYSFSFTLVLLARQPVPTLMTAAVIGIALALPTGMYMLLENARQLSAHWDGSLQISLFLRQDISDEQAAGLQNSLRHNALIGGVQLITRAQALEEYRQLSGFQEALQALAENPLPAVLVVQPKLQDASVDGPRLLDSLQALPEVEVAQYDMHWLKRLFAILELVRRGVLILAGILALAVVLVVGNTIRLAIDNRREEIEITKLFGATDGFIRRPFLYLGLWYGLGGALAAWMLTQAAFYALQGPIQKLTLLYHSNFEWISLDWHVSLALFTGGALLGLSGAWLAVTQQLRRIEPH